MKIYSANGIFHKFTLSGADPQECPFIPSPPSTLSVIKWSLRSRMRWFCVPFLLSSLLVITPYLPPFCLGTNPFLVLRKSKWWVRVPDWLIKKKKERDWKSEWPHGETRAKITKTRGTHDNPITLASTTTIPPVVFEQFPSLSPAFARYLFLHFACSITWSCEMPHRIMWPLYPTL